MGMDVVWGHKDYGYATYGKGGAPVGYGGKGHWYPQDYAPSYYPFSFKSNEWDVLPPVLICPVQGCQALHSNAKQKQCRFCHHSPLTLINPKDDMKEETAAEATNDKGKGAAKGTSTSAASPTTLPTTATSSPSAAAGEQQQAQAHAGQAAGKGGKVFTIDQTKYVLTQPLLKSHLELKHYLVANGYPANLDQGEEPILPSQAALDPAKAEALKDLNLDLVKAKSRGQNNIIKAIEEELKTLQQANTEDAKSPSIDAIYLDQVTLAKTKSARWLNESADAAKKAIKQQAGALMKRFKEIETQQELAIAQYATLNANITLAHQLIKVSPQEPPLLTAGDISNQLLKRKEGFVTELSNKENIVNAVSALDGDPLLSQLGPDALKAMKDKMHEVFTMGIHGTLAQTVTLIGSGFYEPQTRAKPAMPANPESIEVPDDEEDGSGDMEDDFPNDWEAFNQD